MQQCDLDLIDSIRPTHRELDRLLADHRDYERRLSELARQRWRSTDDYAEEQLLKRKKLAGRDRIHEILAQHRLSA